MFDIMTGNEVRAIRSALGLTQAELAERIGISRTFVGLMERGQKLVSKRTAAAIRAATPRAGDRVPTEADPQLRRLETALISQGVEFEQQFHSDGEEFDFFLPQLSLAIVVDHDSSRERRPTRDIRSVIVARGAAAADIVSLLLERRSLRTAVPGQLNLPPL
jgi:transcriptional regulator with XRE-family HTH domain